MWPTPTPIPQGTPQFDLGINPDSFGQNIAGGVVQGWNVLNAQAFSDLIYIFLIVLIIILGIISIRRHLETL